MTAAAHSLATVPHAGGLRVEAFADEGAFHRLEAAWRRLVEDAGVEHPFLGPDWARTWWDCFAGGRQLRILVVKSGEVPVALVPLALGTGRIYGTKVRRLEFLHNPHVPRCDVLVAGEPGEVYAALWEHLAGRARAGEWDILQLADVPAESRTLSELTARAQADGFSVGLWPSLESPYVPLCGTWEQYFHGLDLKHRSNLRNRMKRLEALGPVDLEVVTAGPALDSALDDGFRLEAAAWKGRAGTAILSRRDTEAFYRRLASVSSERGSLRLHFLRVGGQRVAFEYTLRHEGRLHVLKLGYDPRFSRFSPQNLLCSLVLKDALGRGGVEYDFLGTSEPWKREWARHARRHAWLFVLRPGRRLRLVYDAKFRLLPLLRRGALYQLLHAWVFGGR